MFSLNESFNFNVFLSFSCENLWTDCFRRSVSDSCWFGLIIVCLWNYFFSSGTNSFMWIKGNLLQFYVFPLMDYLYKFWAVVCASVVLSDKRIGFFLAEVFISSYFLFLRLSMVDWVIAVLDLLWKIFFILNFWRDFFLFVSIQPLISQSTATLEGVEKS